MPGNDALELHVVISDEIDIVFHPPSLTFLKVNRKAATILKSYTEGRTIEDCASLHGCAPEEIEGLLRKLRVEIERQTNRRPVSLKEPQYWFGRNRLALFVSMDCNMRCTYCYAGGGNYGKARQLMSEAVALQSVDLFTRGDEFSCNHIMFFGGEPSLNVPVIRLVCEHLAGRARGGQIPHIPGLGIVTNGLHLSEELLALITQYAIGVTVSLDGPPEIHDRQRVDVGGKGTYERVARSIRRLLQATSGRQPEMIEVAITKKHIEMGFTYDVLANFFATELGVREFFTSMDTSVPDTDYTSWDVPHQTNILNKLAKGELRAHNVRILETLVSKRIMPYLCPLGLSMFSVDAEGGIYPCGQFLNDSFCMGNIFEPAVFTSERFKRVQEALRANGKYEHEQCRACWARGLCTACPARIYARTGNLYDRSEALCSSAKKSLEIILCRLAKLHGDKESWGQITRNLQKETQLGLRGQASAEA